MVQNIYNTVNFYALRRSGQHAIIFWFLKKFELHLEPTSHQSDHFCSPDRVSVHFYNDQPIWPADYNKTNNHYNNIAFKENLSFKNSTFITRNFEDKCLHPRLVDGKNIIIVRDILNLVASRWKMVQQAIDQQPYLYTQESATNLLLKFITKTVPKIIHIWKKHVIYLNSPDPKNVAISYNEWVSSLEYRNQICNILNIPKEVDIINQVPHHGRGSSFIRYKLDKPSNYLSRYTQVNFPKKIIESLLYDKHLIQLNKDFFNIQINDDLLKKNN